MKETVKCSRALGQLEKMYRALNEDKFEGKLEMPIITIQSTPRAYGHVTVGKVWHSSKDTKQYELNIGAGTMDRPIECVVSTLLHEMVHIYHLMNGIQDCSRGGTYHNKIFKSKAESVGLLIDYDKSIGYSITSPSDDLILYIADKGWNDLMIGRSEGYVPFTGIGGNSAGRIPKVDGSKKPSSTRKYKCPSCGNSFRATKNLNVICGDCNVSFELCE